MRAESFDSRVRQALHAGRRWHPAEIAFWCLAFAAFLLFTRNLLLLNEGMHFFCGDLVSFYYEVDTAGFFISADVNDVTIAP